MDKRKKSNWRNLLDRLKTFQNLSSGQTVKTEKICFLFRRLLEEKADRIWRLIKEEEEINLNIWKNVKSQFQQHFPTRMKTLIVKEIQNVYPKTKATQMPRAGVLNLLVLAYPQIKIVPLCVPPNKKFYTNKLHLGGFFKFVYPCGLLAYPLWPLYVPLGVRVPQVENRWPRVIQGISNEINTFADCC